MSEQQTKVEVEAEEWLKATSVELCKVADYFIAQKSNVKEIVDAASKVNFEAAKVEQENADLKHRVRSLQCLLDQRWEMMRELEEACGTKDVAKAVEYIKGLKSRVKRLEEAGDRMRRLCADGDDCDAWDLAKEAKP